MKTTRNLSVAVLSLLLSLEVVAQTVPAAGVDPAGWVPEDALIYVGIDDVGKLIEQFKHTAYYRMTQDPNAKSLSGQMSLPVKVFDVLKKHVAQSLGIEPDKLKNPFGGPLAFYVSPPQGSDGDSSPVVVLVAGVGDAELMRDYYDKASRKFREASDNHERISFRSFSIDEFTKDQDKDNDESGDEDEPNMSDFDSLGTEEGVEAMLDKELGKLFSSDAMPKQFAMCLTEDRLIISQTSETVKDVLRREKSGDSLLDADTYKTLVRKFKPLGSLRMLVNLEGLFEVMVREEGDEAKQTLAMLGANGMRALIGHARYDGKGFESKLELVLLLNGERTGLAKIFSMKNTPIQAPTMIPAENFIYARVGVNVLETLDEIERMIRQQDPAAADEMHAGMESIEMGDGEKLNLRKELLEVLATPLTVAMGFEKPYGPESTRLLVTLGHRDREAISRFLEKLSSLSGGMFVSREARGTMVYDMAFGGFSLAPTEKRLLVGTTNAVDAALQSASPDQSLAADPQFKKALALAPKEAWGVLYTDSRRMYKAAIEMAKNKDELAAAQFSNPASMVAVSIVQALTTGIKEDQLDTAKKLAKYQASAIITIATTPDGIRMTQVQLKPESE